MQIVIDISEDTYNFIKSIANDENSWVISYPIKESIHAITRGILLPKEHGRLVDVSKLLVSILKYIDGDKTLGQCIDDTPTVIDAEG